MERMDECLERLAGRVRQCAYGTDLDQLTKALDSVEGPVLICGSGGSFVAASFLDRVLTEKRGLACRRVKSRAAAKMNTAGFRSLIAVSYGGGNLGVRMALEKAENTYLFSCARREDALPLTYGPMADREESYVSLAATLGPMAAALMYYTGGDRDLLEEILAQEDDLSGADLDGDVWEIMGGVEEQTACSFLESAMTEAGLCAPVLHDRYDFCHGRVNLSRRLDTGLVWFAGDSGLDGLVRRELLAEYGRTVVLERRYEDPVVNDFSLTMGCVRLAAEMARRRGVDLSSVEEWEKNDLFYLYEGDV